MRILPMSSAQSNMNNQKINFEAYKIPKRDATKVMSYMGFDLTNVSRFFNRLKDNNIWFTKAELEEASEIKHIPTSRVGWALAHQ